MGDGADECSWLIPATDHTYKDWLRGKGRQTGASVPLKHGAVGHWVGDKNAKNVIVYYHGTSPLFFPPLTHLKSDNINNNRRWLPHPRQRRPLHLLLPTTHQPQRKRPRRCPLLPFLHPHPNYRLPNPTHPSRRCPTPYPHEPRNPPFPLQHLPRRRLSRREPRRRCPRTHLPPTPRDRLPPPLL